MSDDGGGMIKRCEGPSTSGNGRGETLTVGLWPILGIIATIVLGTISAMSLAYTALSQIDDRESHGSL